jgi:hypothetical protein
MAEPPLVSEGDLANDPLLQTASFSSLAGRKDTFLVAAIWMTSPVPGLRPVRASARDRKHDRRV